MPQETEVRLYGEVGPAWAGMIDDVSVIRMLDEIDARKIHVRLNSPGGDYFMGVSISNAFRRHQAKIIVHVDALAASAASVIAMGADRVVMHPGSLLMIHQAWSVSMGNADDMAKAADALRKVDDSLRDIYHRKTGMDKAKLKQLIEAETWMSAEEAVAMGFADETDSTPTGAMAKVPDGWYARTPDKVGRYSLAASARKPELTIAAKTNPKEIEARRQRLKSFMQTVR